MCILFHSQLLSSYLFQANDDRRKSRLLSTGQALPCQLDAPRLMRNRGRFLKLEYTKSQHNVRTFGFKPGNTR